MTPTPPPPTTGAVSEGPRFAALCAYHRCSDLHPERFDMGGVGTCRVCWSWGENLAAALHAEVARWLGDVVAANAVTLPHGWAGYRSEFVPTAALAALTAPTAEGSGR